MAGHSPRTLATETGQTRVLPAAAARRCSLEAGRGHLPWWREAQHAWRCLHRTCHCRALWSSMAKWCCVIDYMSRRTPNFDAILTRNLLKAMSQAEVPRLSCPPHVPRLIRVSTQPQDRCEEVKGRYQKDGSVHFLSPHAIQIDNCSCEMPFSYCRSAAHFYRLPCVWRSC